MARPLLRVLRLGVTPYLTALDLQTRAAARRSGRIPSASASPAASASADSPRFPPCPDLLVALQHPPVITVGKRRAEGERHILAGEAEVRAAGVEVHSTARGGDATFHGPGQAVLYPVLRLPDLRLGARRYVEGLEDVMVRCAARFGVEARGRIPGRTGVWVGWDEGNAEKGENSADCGGRGGDRGGFAGGGSGEAKERKIGAVGVQISSGVTRHGLAFNISTDLSFFKLIVPCGIEDRGVTSLLEEGRRLVGEGVRRREGVREGSLGVGVGVGMGVEGGREGLVGVSCNRVADGGVDVAVEAVTDVLIEEFLTEFGFEEERCSSEEQWLR